MQSPRVPAHVLRRQRRDAPRPRPHFDDAIMPDLPADLPYYPRFGETFSNLPGSLGRTYEGLKGLLSPPDLIAPLFGEPIFTEEQHAVGQLVGEAARLFFDRSTNITHFEPRATPPQIQSQYPALTGLIDEAYEWTPLGSHGWRSPARQFEKGHKN